MQSDRFYKTDESHGKDKTGVGLGLAIVRSIINLHEGNILVKSTKGEYTEFSFSNKLWPDFDKNDLENLVKDYYGRNRRFGKL